MNEAPTATKKGGDLDIHVGIVNSARTEPHFIAAAGQKFGVAGTNLLCNVGRLRGPLVEVECTPAPNRLVRVGAYGFALSDLRVSVNRVSASYAPVEVFIRRRRPPYVVGDLAPASQPRSFFNISPGDLVRLSRTDIACSAFRSTEQGLAIQCYIAPSPRAGVLTRTFSPALTQRAVIVQAFDKKGHVHVIYTHRQPG